ncbi:MAG: DUF5667 domain-containing protein [Patescibacteria group bacterium]|jgi:hypothetical protein
MTEKELIQKLNSLKVSPDSSWKEKNRDILMSQLFPGEDSGERSGMKTIERLDVWSEVFVPFDLIHKMMARPVLVTIMVMIALLGGGGVASLKAAKNSKPGDSLYIAKIINEKAQLALTFNEKEKAKLGVEFAGNRAKEAVQVMEEGKNEADKSEKVGKLAEEFKNEIDKAKGRLEKIGVKDVAVNNGEKDNAKGSEDQDKLFGANAGRNGEGIQISGEGGKKEEAPKVTAGQGETKATSTAGNAKTLEKKATPENILDEAQELFEKKDYGGAADKLEKMYKIIDDIKEGASIDSNATSTSGKMEMTAKQ